MLANQTGNPLVDLINGNVPLGGLQVGRGVAWSLLNLMMSIIALLNAILLLVTMFKKKREAEYDELNEYEGFEEHEAEFKEYVDRNEQEEDEEEYEPESIPQRLIRLKVPALLAGIIPGILFLILENIRLPVTWITRWTPLIGAFFIIHMVLVLTQYAIKRKEKLEDEEDEEGEELEQDLEQEQGAEGVIAAADLG